MNNRMNTLPRRAVGTVDSWRLREAEARSRILDCLLFWSCGALPAAAPPPMGKTIFFREGSSRLDGKARAALRDRSAVLKAKPGIRVVIGGLASQVGSTTFAMGLGLQRVRAIRTFLLSQGIDPARIEVAIRGAQWSLIDRPCRASEEAPSGECRLQIADPQWALWRN